MGFATPGLSSACLNTGEGHGEAVSSLLYCACKQALGSATAGRLGLDLAAKTLCNRVAGA
jgi:hypothetical protein